MNTKKKKTYYIKVENFVEWMYERGADQDQEAMKLKLADRVVESMKKNEPYIDDFQNDLDGNCGLLPTEYIEGKPFEYDCELGELTDNEIDWDNAEFKILYPDKEEDEKCDRCGKVDDGSETYFTANDDTELICKSCVESWK